jgi:hypothetical protein
MEIETSYFSGSGSFFAGCCFIAQRYDRATGFKSGEGESWVFDMRDGADGKSLFTNVAASDSWFTALWRSPAANVYVTDADLAEVHSAHIPPGSANVTWRRTRLDSPLYGIWGLDDGCIFAWGSTFQKDYPLFRFGGGAWNRVGDPGFRIYSMHGTAPDLIYAVGDSGRIARFDGRGWQAFPSPTSELLTSVFVVGGDEIYACGRQGSLLEGSSTGWGKIAEGPGLPGPLLAVVKWQEQVWVGAGRFGLLRRVGLTDQLEVIKPNIPAEAFDARDDMLITCPDFLAGTKDGKAFKGAGKDIVKKRRETKALLDFS